ncbi:MAG TPA: aromatic ring-hydroxylating dioxygenase subunit alpha [Candidatus Cybelea sp.]|nr:aromatic ring-hydroxylating dioxygenase subunit alpha [Candidatus Cybelea sp.]
MRNSRDETLPGWTYDDAEFHALEREHLLLGSWVLAGHRSDLKAPGDFLSLEHCGERGLVILGEDGKLRGFFNTCRHRAHALVSTESGSCRHAIRCPYHGWSYAFDGRLKAIAAEKSFPAIDKAEFGLKAIEVEEFLGFVFARFKPPLDRRGGTSVAERFAPYRTEMEAYRTTEMVSRGTGWHCEIAVDWKNLIDNYLEGYHVPTGHPGLQRMFGNSYTAEAQPTDVSRQVGIIRDKPSENWSERMYQRVAPTPQHLPEARRRAWCYYTLLPNLALDFYPEQVTSFEALPLGPGKVRLRARRWMLPAADRRTRAAQYLSYRINSQVQREDEMLVASVQQGLKSRGYSFGIFSEKEVALRQMHEMIRRAIPVARLAERPAQGTLAAVNAQMNHDLAA